MALSEYNTAGYRVMRSHGFGNAQLPASAVVVNSAQIRAGGTGGQYELVDASAPGRNAVTYWLVEVDVDGSTHVIARRQFGAAFVYLPVIRAAESARGDAQEYE